MKLPEFVTPPYIYCGCSTQKTLWEGNLTPVDMKSCGCRNVRKHKGIKNGKKYIILDISLKFGIMDKMKITSSESKDCLGISGKGLITSLGIKTIDMSKKDKKASCAITNVILKDLYYIIKEFENFPYEGYVQKRTKHEPTDSYFYPEIQPDKCMFIYDTFNLKVDPVRT